MSKLCERSFSKFEVVRTNEVSLDLFALVRAVEITPFGVGVLKHAQIDALF
jgi:hypothetical protein